MNKGNWNVFVNIVCIVALFLYDWVTGESSIVYPQEAE